MHSGFTFDNFLTRKGLPLSTTVLSSLKAEQLLEELGIGGFFKATSCDRANYTTPLPSGFEIGKKKCISCIFLSATPTPFVLQFCKSIKFVSKLISVSGEIY